MRKGAARVDRSGAARVAVDAKASAGHDAASSRIARPGNQDDIRRAIREAEGETEVIVQRGIEEIVFRIVW